ncbi:MAG TPA: HNH endonuclease [Microbacteriaceae bacterium]
MYSAEVQAAISEDVFSWLDKRRASGIEELARAELLDYRFGKRLIPLVDRNRGIRNPAEFDATLSILTSPTGPYDDIAGADGLVHYAYRDGDPYTGDNRKLRRAMELGVPLVYFQGVRAGYYVPVYPVYVVGDDLKRRTFAIALDKSLTFLPNPLQITADTRSYAERMVRQRLHQPMFRAQVIHAHDRSCAVCHLHHPDLLDAAHILPDSAHAGIPVVSNGLALCKIHHAAYDRNLLGITPDHEVRINAELLAEVDGPMLRHGLQEMHGSTITLPKRRAERPSRDALAVRFAEFVA